MLYLSHASFLFGWAKPVPYNPYNLTNQKWGEAIVAAAGPGANFLLAIIFGVMVRMRETIGISDLTVELLLYIVLINVFLGVFNLIPLPPLDGSKVIEPFLPLGLRNAYRALGARIEALGFIGMVLILFILVMVIGDPFFNFVGLITGFLTGVQY
jgi:Zn-dependent protease